MVNIGRHSREGFDLCDTTHCQVWRAAATAASRRAVLATAGQVLTYNGAPAEVFYSASCGGHTENAGDVWARGALFPYLRGVPDDVHESEPCRGGSNARSTKCARLWRVRARAALAWRTSGSRAARPVAG